MLLAASSAVETYGGQGGQVVSRVHEGSTLPTTGSELLVLIGVALLVFLAGLVMALLASREWRS